MKVFLRFNVVMYKLMQNVIFAVMSVMILALVSVFSILLLNTERRELKEASCNYENFGFRCIQKLLQK